MQHPIQIGSAGGEYMDTVLVLQWAVPLGAAVKAGEVVVTVETAKAATEVEAPADGQLVEICFGPGQEAPVGAVLGRLDDAPGTAAAAATPAAPAPARTARTDGAARLEQLRAGRLVASPSARRAARERHVDLAQVTGTGPRGRIKRADVEAASRANAAAVAPAAAGSPLAAPRPAAPAAIGPEPLPIVLLHGFGADRTSWWPLARHLDARHRLVLPELPGHGQAAPRTVATVEDLAFAVADQLRAQGVEAAHVVGHSLGGAVAIALADLGLVAARSLGLIAPGGLGPEINTAFIRGLAGAARAEELQPWLEVMVADPAALPAGFAQAVMRQRPPGGTALRTLADALFGEGTQTMRLGQRLARLEMPAKVIWGRRDRVIPPAHAADLPGHVGLHLLAEVGHVPQLEAPALVARLVDELVHAGH